MLWETILGGLTGLVGNMVTSYTTYKTQQLKNKHDEQMYDYKIKELTAKTDAAIKITDAKIAGAVELADTEAFTVSQKVGNVKSFSDGWIDKLFKAEGWLKWLTVPCASLIAIGFGFLDFLKGLMRPGLTLYLTAITSWITWKAYEILMANNTTLSTTEALALYTEVTSIVIYLAVSCITWWFGDRRVAKFLMRMDDGNIKPKTTIN